MEKWEKNCIYKKTKKNEKILAKNECIGYTKRAVT